MIGLYTELNPGFGTLKEEMGQELEEPWVWVLLL